MNESRKVQIVQDERDNLLSVSDIHETLNMEEESRVRFRVKSEMSPSSRFVVEPIEDCQPFDTPEGIALDDRLRDWENLTREQQTILKRIRRDYMEYERTLLGGL